MLTRTVFIVALTLLLGACSQTPPAVSDLTPVAEETAATLATPEIMTRQEWGWVPLTDTIPEHEISYITIHHGGEDFPEDKDMIAYLKGLSAWSRSDKGWIDNPYHYMIDLQGKLYEARPIQYPGDTNTSYDPRGHALICVVGNYENQILSEAQFESLAHLTAWLAETYDVPAERIKGHKDYTETLCPGKDLYRYLEDGSLLERVEALRP